MRMRSISSSITSLVLPVLLLCLGSVLGVSRVGRVTPAFADITPNKKALKDLTVEHKNQAGGMTKLRFQASTSYATQPTKYRPGCSLTEFFFREEHRDMLLAGSSSHNRVQVVRKPERELYHLWEDQAAKNRFALPSMGDPILRVTTTGINFPGLAIRTIATVGCKKVFGTDHPELQITLICDELEVQGPEPLVWVFNQLTGGGGGNKKKDMVPQLKLFPFFETPKAKSSERSTQSSNSISAEKTENGEVIFHSVVRLAIDMSFPTLLLNVLPVSKQMAEQQGSEVILEVVERDIGPSLEALRERYEKDQGV
jgi:hypothetical protein